MYLNEHDRLKNCGNCCSARYNKFIWGIGKKYDDTSIYRILASITQFTYVVRMTKHPHVDRFPSMKSLRQIRVFWSTHATCKVSSATRLYSYTRGMRYIIAVLLIRYRMCLCDVRTVNRAERRWRQEQSQNCLHSIFSIFLFDFTFIPPRKLIRRHHGRKKKPV